MHDLVVLDNATVGVVVNVEADALRVLTNQVGGGRAAGARRRRAGTCHVAGSVHAPRGWLQEARPCVEGSYTA